MMRQMRGRQTVGEASGGELVADGGEEAERLAIGADELVLGRVKAQLAGKGLKEVVVS